MRTFASKHVATGLPYSRWTAAFCVVAPHRAPEAVSFRALRALSAVARYPARGSDSQRVCARAPPCAGRHCAEAFLLTMGFERKKNSKCQAAGRARWHKQDEGPARPTYEKPEPKSRA